MATIDDKVVAMSFENSKFEAGVAQSISSLDKLKAALHFPSSGKGFDELNRSAKAVDLSHISSGVQKIQGALEALRLVAISVFSQLATRAVLAGSQMVKALTLDPLKQGLQEYETQINAVQVILSNTAVAGVKIKDVNAALDQLNNYADKTIYNFGQMTKNVGTFTAAGVDLKTSVASIKGIANMAALSGSSAEQASTAMYQLSQAISSGKVALMDWRSVENASMGSATFKRALAETALHMGTLKQSAVEMVGPMKNIKIEGESFRNSLASKPGEKSWLTSDVLTTTLKQLSGDMTNAQLAAEGYTKAEIKNIQQMAQTALKAATTVKTFTQLVSTTKEQLGTGWASTFEILLGDFAEAKVLFTGISTAIGGFVSKSADARNRVLQDWKDMGGRTALIEALKTAFHNLGMVVKPIKEAFREIFPAKTGADLMYLTQQFERFVEKLKPGPETIENLKRTFKGLFALLDIGKQIIGGIFTMFGKLFGALGDGSGGFLEITGGIGDFLVKVDEALKKGNRLHNFFAGLGTILAAPLKLLSALANALGKVFSGFSSGGISSEIGGLTKAMSPLERIFTSIANAWDKLVASISNADLTPMIEAISSAIQGIAKAIGDAASNMNFEAILAVVRTGLLGGIVLMLKNFFGKGTFLDQIGKGFGGGILANISGSFDALRGSMVAMQNNIKADTLQKIAIAIGILTAAVVALSFVDADGLKKSISAIGFMMAELMGAMAILSKISGLGGFLKVPLIAASMIMLAGAIDILAIAVFALGKLSWSELVKGLGGVAALLGMMVAAVGPLSAASPGLIRAGIGITAIAIALNLLALAVRQMGSMDLEQLAKGLGGVGIALGGIMVAMKKMPPSAGMVTAGAGMIAIAIALKIMASAVAQFGEMDLRTIAQGIGGIALVLGMLVLGMTKMPTKSLLKNAIGLIAIATALKIIGTAVESMGGQSMGEVAKGLIGLAGALAILVIAVAAFQGMLTGAIALGIVAGGVNLLSSALQRMGSMSWGEMLKSLLLLAGALTVIGIAGALITPVIPSLLGLGLALLAIGAGLALAGAGIFLFSAGLSALLVALPTGVGIIMTAIKEFQKGLIENAKLLATGVLEVIKAFAATAPQFVDALIKILNSIIDAIIEILPKVAELFGALIETVIGVLQANQGKIIQAGFDLIIALLQGIRNNIPALVTQVVGIIVAFIQTLTNNLPKIIAAGVQLFLALIKGVIQQYALIVSTVLDLIVRFIGAVTSNLPKILTAGIAIFTSLLKGISQRLGELIKVGADAVVNFIKGITDAAVDIVRAARTSAAKFMNTLATEIPKFADDVFNALIKLINGMATTIQANTGPLRSAGLHLGYAIMDGMSGGLLSKAKAVIDTARNIGGSIVGAMKGAVGADSPAKETIKIGMYIMDGLYKGISGNGKASITAAEEMSRLVIGKFAETFQTYSPSKVMYDIGRYVGDGFALGLRESKETILAVWKELDDKLIAAASGARETIASEQKKLAELRAADKPNAEAIKEAQKVIAENQLILKQSVAGHKALTQELTNEKAELIKLVTEYNALGERMKTAREDLKALQQEKAAAVQGFSDQYSELPAITPGEGTGQEQLAAYLQALQDQKNAVATYAATIEELRKLGLNKETYEKLVEEGTADQEFASALLAGGKTAVEGLNKLDVQLNKESEKLAKQAAGYLHNSGIQAAKGLIKGLQSQMDDLRAQAEAMADAINKAFNMRLKLKSPSRVFMENGVNIMKGLAIGITDSTKMVTDAVEGAADAAIDAMKSSMSKVSEVIMGEVDSNPVITPVLDLTQVRAQAGELGALTNVTPITAAASYGQAATISAEQLAAQSEEVAAAGIGGTSVKFEQNNYSPESLTEIEIYRQTKNQLSQLKSALSLS